MNGIFDTNLGTFGAANSLPGKFDPYVLVDIIWLARWIGPFLQTNFDVNVFSEKWILLKLELSTKIFALIGISAKFVGNTLSTKTVLSTDFCGELLLEQYSFLIKKHLHQNWSAKRALSTFLVRLCKIISNYIFK